MTQREASPIRGWTVVLAAVSINLILGVLYAWSVMGIGAHILPGGICMTKLLAYRGAELVPLPNADY